MKNSRILQFILISFASLFFISINAEAQSINAYSVLYYDSSTNTLDGYSYTAPSYELATYYSSTVSSYIQDDNGNLFAQGSQTKNDGSWAQVEMIVPGNGCKFYTISADHADHAEYYLYYMDGGYEEGYYDPYNFSYFEEFASEEGPYWQSAWFFGPGPSRLKSINEGNYTLLGTTTEIGSGTCNLAPEIQIHKGSLTTGPVIASNRTPPVPQTVSVGEQVTLTTSISGGTASNRNWTIPGNRIASYSNVLSSTAIVTGITTNALAQSTISYYWVNGGDNREVKHTAQINNHSYSAKAKFHVKRPTSTFSATTSNVTLGMAKDNNGNDRFGLHFGKPFDSVSSKGIIFNFNVDIPSGISGHWFLVQLVSASHSSTPSAGQTQLPPFQGSGLDTAFPYSDLDVLEDEDSPAIDTSQPCNFTSLVANDSFQTYLMFLPSVQNVNTIPVPLKKVTWSWSGTATRGSSCSSWTLSNNHPSQATTIVGQDVSCEICFPEWSQIITGDSY